MAEQSISTEVSALAAELALDDDRAAAMVAGLTDVRLANLRDAADRLGERCAAELELR